MSRNSLLRTTALFLPLLLTGGHATPAEAEPFPYKSFHVEQTSGRMINGVISLKVAGPNIAARQWLLYFPCPPDMHSQKLMSFGSNDAKFQKTAELSSVKREVLRALIPASNSNLYNKISARCYYQIRLLERGIAPGPDNDKPARKLQTPAERLRYVSTSTSYDFQSPEFKAWLKNNRLLKQTAERDVDFAWRAFATIRKLYEYKYEQTQNRCVSALCQTDSTDCGGLSFLFIATLRANDVPARALIGRWLKPDDQSGAAQNEYGTTHVKAEFLANEAGWVPVDLSQAVSNKTQAQSEYFGKCSSDFVTLHIDPDMEMDTIWFGTKSVPFFQSALYWVSGTGSTGDATVESSWQTSPASR